MAPLQQKISVSRPKTRRSKNFRPKNSAINKFAVGFATSEIPTNSRGEEVYKCIICQQDTPEIAPEYVISSGQTGFRYHLLTKHNINVPTLREMSDQKILESTQKITDFAGFDRPESSQNSCKSSTFDQEGVGEESHFRALLLSWLLEENLPFTTVAAESFRRLVMALAPSKHYYIPRSASTIRSDLNLVVQNKMPEAQASLTTAISKVHLVFDAWSTPSRSSVLGVVARYIDSDYRLQSHVLSLTEMPQSHTGVALAEQVLATTEKFKVTERIGFIISDSASNMDSCIENMEVLLEGVGISWDQRYHRVRCLAHIIHLAATAFFFPDGCAPEDPYNYVEWRPFACFGKLHNVVRYIRASAGRINAWKKLSDLMPLLDNKTRWNSWFDMCNRALQPDVRAALVQTLDQENELRADYLSPQDFDDLGSLTRFLKPFRDWTLQSEGLRDSMDMVLPAYDALLSHLEASKVEYADNEFMARRVEASWLKLNNYYNQTDQTSAYFAATVLNPTLKLAYFTHVWGGNPALEQHIIPLKTRMFDRWQEEYLHSPVRTRVSSERSLPRRDTSGSLFSGIQGAFSHRNSAEDELEMFLREPVLGAYDVPDIQNFRALEWWCGTRQRHRYPCLHRYALDLLSVPPQSSEIERVFSECKASLTQQRNKMSISTLEQVQQMRSWLRSARRADEALINVLPLQVEDNLGDGSIYTDTASVVVESFSSSIVQP